MEQKLLTEQSNFPTISFGCVESAKSNYATYQSTSSTNDESALIDIMENVLVVVNSDL